MLQEDKVGEANSDDEYSSAMLVDPEQGFMGEFSIIICINTIVLKSPHYAARYGSREPPPRSHVGFLIIQKADGFREYFASHRQVIQQCEFALSN